LRNLQKTILQKAIRKLDEESVEKRVAKAVIFSTSKANFSRAREILNDAITRIVALADESHEERNKVLCFSAQLFSVLEDS
jgi:16S rRNA C1402 N4-methylase RsmH